LSASNVNERDCVAGTDPFAFYITADAAIAAAKEVVAADELIDEPTPDMLEAGSFSFPNPAKFVSAALLLAGEITEQGFEYAKALVDDCYQADQVRVENNSDAVAVNGFNLEQQNEQTMAAIESSINTIHDQLHVVQQTVDSQLTLDIRRALSQPTSSPKNVNYELPASVGGNLDSTPIGVQAIVTNAYNAAKQAGLSINANATSYLNAANSALAAKNDRTAWADYQLAYQALR
jgi:hypothetical protein